MAAKSKVVTRPAPTGGWNARDSIANMPRQDAVTLTNYVPFPSAVSLRYGYSQYATGFPGQVETILAYAGGSTNKLFGIAGTAVYDATSGGAVGAASLSGLTNARWQYTNVATTGGNFLMMVNGTDKLRGYNGAAWWTDGDGTHDITGIDTATISQINIFKNRVWLIPNTTLKAWYLPVQSVGGAASSLDLSAYAPHGGYLMAMGTWTMDSGYGPDDYAVFVTNKGDVIVFKGTDPSSATTWALAGVWWIGAPVGRRCLQKYENDLLIICQDGLFPMSGALQGDRLDPNKALSAKIQFAISSVISTYGSNFGWEVLPYPKENLLFLNVPISTGSSQQQYVMSTIPRANGEYAWCNFTGWNANTWCLYNDDPYFGGNTYIAKAWNTYSDAGTAINGLVIQAFDYYGSQSLQKRFTMMRPTLFTNGNPQIYAGVNVDFNTLDPVSPLTYTPTTYGQWDSGVWDSAIWGSDLSVSNQWQGVTGIGYAGAPVFKSSSSGIQVQLVSSDIVLEPGGVL